MQGWTLDRARFESNAAELEAALELFRKTAQSPDLQIETAMPPICGGEPNMVFMGQ